jgi:hypothetical protein
VSSAGLGHPGGTSLWGRLFDRVVVVSLPRSIERRAHVVDHFRLFGLDDYAFFDATSADDQAMARVYDTGEVCQYPPCFRCGGLDCGNPDCNNFLIPAQIATFITYRRLWRDIATGSAERVLVLEDDVLFHACAHDVLRQLEEEIAAGRVPFVPGAACLLRLGWALGPDHRAGTAVRVSQDVRMANPCHALTRSYAASLVARDKGIVHTVDVYQHKIAPRPGEAWTVFPPIASDLSWSVGSVDSTIHPKTLRSAWLRESGDEAAAASNDRRVASHVKKKHFRPLLVVGHPGCGTAELSATCRRWGVDVGEERLGAAGIGAWAFAVETDANPDARDEVSRNRNVLVWQWLVLSVRDIAQAAGAAMREAQRAPASDTFRRQHILRLLGIDLDSIGSPLARAVWSVTSWCRIVLDQAPELVVRVEDGSASLRAFLIARGLAPDEAVTQDLNAAAADRSPHGSGRTSDPLPSPSDWSALDEVTLREVIWYCERFGYALPEGCRP